MAAINSEIFLIFSNFLLRKYWRRSGVFIVNFEHISHFVLLFLLLVNFEQLNTKWGVFANKLYHKRFTGS